MLFKFLMFFMTLQRPFPTKPRETSIALELTQ